jgi:head-tail adaptor
MPIAAGKLDQRIQIQRQEKMQDGAGQPVGVWVDFVKTWGNIKFPTGSATMQVLDSAAGADVSVVRCSIQARWRADIDAGMRVVTKFGIFDLKAVLPDGDDGMFLVCEVSK